nr:hypothetical protein CFP56_20867 [Quercus suber]
MIPRGRDLCDYASLRLLDGAWLDRKLRCEQCSGGLAIELSRQQESIEDEDVDLMLAGQGQDGRMVGRFSCCPAGIRGVEHRRSGKFVQLTTSSPVVPPGKDSRDCCGKPRQPRAFCMKQVSDALKQVRIPLNHEPEEAAVTMKFEVNKKLYCTIKSARSKSDRCKDEASSQPPYSSSAMLDMKEELDESLG